MLEARLAELYTHRKQQAEEIAKLKEQVANKEVELAKKDVTIVGLKYCKCIINECVNRRPKRNYEEDFTTTDIDNSTQL